MQFEPQVFLEMALFHVTEKYLIFCSLNGNIIVYLQLNIAFRLAKTRGRYGQDITSEDIQTAIKKLKVLGTGFALHGHGKKQVVQSVPGELNMDHTAIFELAQLVRKIVKRYFKSRNNNIFCSIAKVN